MVQASSRQVSTPFVDKTLVSLYLEGMISPEQCRAARGWLAWTQAELATHAGVALSTVRDFEKGRHFPQSANLNAIKVALERQGVRMTYGDAGTPRGIALAKENPA